MITGEMLIGRHSVRGSGAGFHGTEAATGAALPPVFSGATAGATADDVARACALASGAFDAYRDVPPEQRATFLDASAQSLLDLGDVLIDRACAETGLARGRIEGERGRTVGQLRLFAALVREGELRLGQRASSRHGEVSQSGCSPTGTGRPCSRSAPLSVLSCPLNFVTAERQRHVAPSRPAR